MKKPLQFPVTAVFILCPVVTFEMHHLKQGKMANGNKANCEVVIHVMNRDLKDSYLLPPLLHPPGPQLAFV